MIRTERYIKMIWQRSNIFFVIKISINIKALLLLSAKGLLYFNRKDDK